MEIIPEVARNSGTLICRKDRATLYRFSQNLISSEHFYNVEHSGIRTEAYLLPSVRAYRRPSLIQVMLGRGNPLGALQGITTRAPALTSTSEGRPWNSLSRTENKYPL